MNKSVPLLITLSVLVAVGCNDRNRSSQSSDKDSLYSKREHIRGLNGTSVSVDKSLDMKPAGNSVVEGISKPSEQSAW